MLTMRSVFALVFLILLSQPAAAALNVCNKTKHDARVAIGLFDGTQWSSQGWWPVAASKCATIVPGRLRARYYYLYAEDGGSGIWDGARKFCLGPADKFQSKGRDNCAAQNMDRRGFFPIDTGDKPDYTQTLSD